MERTHRPRCWGAKHRSHNFRSHKYEGPHPLAGSTNPDSLRSQLTLPLNLLTRVQTTLTHTRPTFMIGPSFQIKCPLYCFSLRPAHSSFLSQIWSLSYGGDCTQAAPTPLHMTAFEYRCTSVPIGGFRVVPRDHPEPINMFRVFR